MRKLRNLTGQAFDITNFIWQGKRSTWQILDGPVDPMDPSDKLTYRRTNISPMAK